MDWKQSRRLEEEFNKQHEERANQMFWPPTCADLLVFSEILESWPKDQRQAFWAKHNEAVERFRLSTFDRHEQYRRGEEAAGSEKDKAEAWQRFVTDTAKDRQILRTTVFSTFLEIRKSLPY